MDLSPNSVVTTEKSVYFVGTRPAARWYFRENNILHPYDELTYKIEDVYLKATTTARVDFEHHNTKYTVDFTQMKSYKHGASKEKHLVRGTWFYKVDGKYLPYETHLAKKLEEAFLSGQLARGCDVSTNPHRQVVITPQGFKQFNVNKRNQGRDVIRGYEGKIYEIIQEKVITTTVFTRENLVSAPGAPLSPVF